MKNKILLTSALALAISVPAMAADPTPTTVTSTSSCTETTLGTATGPVDIEADWQANTINLTWNPNNGTVSGGPEQCTYDGTFTLPTSITRTGYEFAGWKVKPSVFDLSTLDASRGGIAYGATRLDGDTGVDEAKYGLTPGSGEWAVEFSYGTIKGMAKCSATNGSWAVAGTPSDTSGGYCWCQPIGFDAEKDGTYMSVNVSSSSWLFYNDSDWQCAKRCAVSCADKVQSNFFGFGEALFGLSAN